MVLFAHNAIITRKLWFLLFFFKATGKRTEFALMYSCTIHCQLNCIIQLLSVLFNLPDFALFELIWFFEFMIEKPFNRDNFTLHKYYFKKPRGHLYLKTPSEKSLICLTFIVESWKTHPENFSKFQFSGTWARRFYWKTHLLKSIEFKFSFL